MICKITPTWYEKLHNSNYNVLTESSQMCLFNIHRCLAVAGGGGCPRPLLCGLGPFLRGFGFPLRGAVRLDFFFHSHRVEESGNAWLDGPHFGKVREYVEGFED